MDTNQLLQLGGMAVVAILSVNFLINTVDKKLDKIIDILDSLIKELAGRGKRR